MKTAGKGGQAKFNMERFTELCTKIEVDEHGHVIPTLEVLRRIEREYPRKHPGEKYQYAQAQMLIDAFEQALEG